MSNGAPREEVALVRMLPEAGREGTPVRLGEGFPPVWEVGPQRERSLQSGLWGSVRLKDISTALKSEGLNNWQTWPVKRHLINDLNFGGQGQK